MSSELRVTRPWDNACPAAVSYQDHVGGLPMVMVQTYWEAGGKGVFVVHPLIASMLAIADPVRADDLRIEGEQAWPLEITRIGGIQAWADTAVPGNEILIVEDREALQAHAVIEISNFIDVPGVLDRMAQIR